MRAEPYYQSDITLRALGGRTYGFSFDAALLSRQVIRTPAELALFLVDFPFRLIGVPPSAVAITQQVRGFLDAVLSHEREVPALNAIAAALGTTEPTLRRRLGWVDRWFDPQCPEWAVEAISHAFCPLASSLLTRPCSPDHNA